MSGNILFIDDDELILIAMGEMLVAEGYVVTTASSGPEGLAKAAATRYDLVVLDVIMPGMQGFDVCHRLRALEGYGGVPIVMLTAMSGEADRARGLASGADHFLPKPIDPTRLLRTLSETIAGSTG